MTTDSAEDGGTPPHPELAVGDEPPASAAEPEADKLADVLEGVIDDPEQRQRIAGFLMRMEMTSAQFRSPYVPPEYLRAYEEIVPGSAAKMISDVHSQTQHRHLLESRTVLGGVRRADIGQWMGLAVALVFAGVVIYATAIHETAVAIAVAAIDIVGLVAVFVLGKGRQEKGGRTPDPAINPPELRPAPAPKRRQD